MFSSHRLALSTLAVATAAMACAAAQAAAVTPFNYVSGAVSQTDANPPGNNNFIIHRDYGQQDSAYAQSTVSISPGPGVPGSINSTATAQANLATGTLRAAANATLGQNASGAVTFATAFIGDSYAHYDGNNPFQWTSLSSSRFTMHITGNSAVSSPNIQLFNSGMVFLIIQPKGTLNSDVAFCGVGFQSYFWSIGQQSNPQNPCGGPGFMGNLNGNVNTTLTLDFSFDGDFDYLLGIRVGGAMGSNGSQGGQWINDFMNTVVVNYTPPVGVSGITSGSGFVLAAQAGGNNAVPLPGSAALAGLGLLLALRRGRIRR